MSSKVEDLVPGTCPVCTYIAEIHEAGSVRIVECPRCGQYVISEEALIELHDAPLSNPAVVSGWIRETRPERILSYSLPNLRQLKAPSITSRLDRLLIAFVKDTVSLGEDVNLQEYSALSRYLAISYSKNDGELEYLIKHLDSVGLVDAQAAWQYPSVTPEGYGHIESLDRNPASPIGFCAMWFDVQVLALWEQAIAPAISAAGYEPKRIDGVEHNNRIDEEIIAWIRRARFVVADLTGHRPGVYFEAGLAMGLGLPVIWLVRHDQLDATHFDNRQYNFIVWADDALPDAMRRIQNRIEATIGRGPQH